MTIIYTPELTEAILAAGYEAATANNGYATLAPLGSEVVTALIHAGYHVTACRDLHGKPADRVYTPQGWAAAVREHNNTIRLLVDTFNEREALRA